MKNRIIIVEDHPEVAELLEMNLQVTGYETRTIRDGAEAAAYFREIKEEEADLVLLDIMLPGMDGFQVLPFIREKGIPVIFLTARDDITSKVKGLREGAEDYIVKPFEILELLVRIEKVLARSGRKQKDMEFGELLISPERRSVTKAGEEIHLKPLEYELLLYLARGRNMVFSREHLLKAVWGDLYMGETRTVDVHVSQLRKKLDMPELIRTIPKLGYRLEWTDEE